MSNEKKKAGTYDLGKPVQHDPKPGTHSGRKHPPALDPNKIVRGLSKDLKVKE